MKISLWIPEEGVKQILNLIKYIHRFFFFLRRRRKCTIGKLSIGISHRDSMMASEI
jgi:hypothetical protein